MEPTEEGLVAFLKEKTQARFQEVGQPYYLSRAASDIKEAGFDYRDILKEEKLKEFSRRTAGPNSFRFVEHPVQKAKVGLVPSNEPFEFESDAEVVPVETGRPARAQGQLLLDFLHALARLPASDLDGIVLPTRVLVKLAAKG